VLDDMTSAIPRLLEDSGLISVNNSMAEAFGNRRLAVRKSYPALVRALIRLAKTEAPLA